MQLEPNRVGNNHVQVPTYSKTQYSNIRTYSSSSAPLFGKSSSREANTFSGVNNGNADQYINMNGFTDELTSTQPLQSTCTFSRVPPLINSPELQLRFLNPSDIPEVKRLCKEWFPIEYPDVWYTDITSNNKFYR